MAIDFYEKEVERLTIRFNRVFGDRAVCDLQSRYASILAICRAGMIARSIRDMPDEKEIGDMTREFCHLREILNRFFDLVESQTERRRHAVTGDSQSIAAGG